MKFLILACFVGLVTAVPLEFPKTLEGERLPIVTLEGARLPLVSDYHLEIGIPLAARIKAAEEASDFTGARITNGSPAVVGQYPHLGGLVVTLNTGATSACGSSLISNTKIVTAAHCWVSVAVSATEFEVVLGSVRLFSGGTRIVTRDVIVHPNYHLTLLYNDIAVGTISWVNFNEFIRTIPLARGNDYFEGRWAWAAGFGDKGDGTGINVDQTLYHTHLQVMSNEDCWRYYTSLVLGSTLCVDGTDGRAICSGDSGGPLEANVDGVRTLIGVTSFGSCDSGFPGGFARITSFNAWIRSHM